MPEALSTISVSTAIAGRAQNEFVRDALRSQRQRLPAFLRGLDDEEWAAQSLCAEWSVHEVVRHLCDATLKSTALLRGEAPEDVGAEGFDPRTTPVTWLSRSSGENPNDTLAVFDDASAELLDEIDRRVRDAIDPSESAVPWLYGPVPWSIAVLHVFWDAWLHERDIVGPLRRPHESPAIESRAAATYGLTTACLPALLRSARLDEIVVLTGDGGGTFRVEAGDGRITTTAGAGAGHPPDDGPLEGELAEVVDSLMDRGPELDKVLRGPPERVERLGKLRTFMLS